ncbi:hypothetical protein MGYG_06952 [Nannizzia gypsea CBS 118893]|uniref:HNH nuclease domain-containing protein n=1 Tax=Arthroderma gypseum (strain ATCC MYA-4604 / CBS 118893) TaxID=535722 RepID=E4V1N8_ARTGP|nr:hypothetical protein MGYG_06952 [Nannizzia gypsea CBS 118893]EFR03953.1 hypothetical protein MGYG_06952 [Nannizzia gypsea CBS 118893]
MAEIKEYLPSKYEHLLPNSNWAELLKSKSQLRRALSDSSPSDTESFIRSKINVLITESNHIEFCKSAVFALYRLKYLSCLEYKTQIRRLCMESTLLTAELRTISPQWSILSNDMNEVLPKYKDFNAAYKNAIAGKPAIILEKESKPEHRANQLRKSVDDFYAGKRVTAMETQGHCHILGWTLYDEVTATHLVPEGLDANAIAFLFGVGNVNIDEPRNTLLLHKNVSKALETGFVVIVPVPAHSPDEEVKWKLFVTDTDSLDEPVSPGIVWNTLHGRELKFLNDNRPAKRYVYFRYVMTFLMLRPHGKLSWIREVLAAKNYWDVPGEYLERTMLKRLVNLSAGFHLPKAFYLKTTFNMKGKGYLPPAEAQEDLTICLANSILMTPDYREPDAVYCGSDHGNDEDNGSDWNNNSEWNDTSDEHSEESFALVS